MIAGLDSSFSRPTPAVAIQARAAGIGLWSGYIATKGGVNLASPWDLASFDIARQVGGIPIAFCSGWDDPVACRNLAAQWNVRLCLDVEDRIRGDGPWVQSWLDASGAGLYGQNSPFGNIHYHVAAFHIGSYYPGYDPSKTWYGPLPGDGTPLGWQWWGDHQEFGLSVDRGWYDNWFAGENPFMALTDQQQQDLYQRVITLTSFQPDPAANPYWGDIFERLYQWAQIGNAGVAGDSYAKGRFDQLAAALKALNTPIVDVNALAAALATHPLMATLSDAERDAVATHVLQHLSKDTAAG